MVSNVDILLPKFNPNMILLLMSSSPLLPLAQDDDARLRAPGDAPGASGCSSPATGDASQEGVQRVLDLTRGCALPEHLAVSRPDLRRITAFTWDWAPYASVSRRRRRVRRRHGAVVAR